jgi:site-specific DNA recombinase
MDGKDSLYRPDRKVHVRNKYEQYFNYKSVFGFYLPHIYIKVTIVTKQGVMTVTIGIYIRVSTQEQAKEGYSIAAQKERLTAFCTALGWKDYKFYVDEGVSAKDTNRPQLQLLLDHIKAGSISILLVYRLDRFTRRVKDLHKMLEFLELHNCAFKSATEPYDTSTAMGKLFITIVAALAEWETDNLSERVKMALEEKASGGERVGNVPFGFDLSDDEKLIKNDQSTVVLEMIELLKCGYSANKIAHYLNQRYDHRQWHPQGVLRIFRNPALYGATRWNDKVFEGTHEGLITKEEFDQLQEILSDRSLHRRRDVVNTYLFQGVVACPQCSRPLSVNRYTRKKKDGSSYTGALYKCQACWKEGNGMVSVGEERILQALKEYMQDIIIKDVKIPDNQNDEREQLIKQKQHIEKKREKYQRAWANDLITDDEFEDRMKETITAYEQIKDEIAKIKAPVQLDTEAIKTIIFTFNQSFLFLTIEEKKQFISRFIRRIEFKFIPQPPKRPDKHRKGKDLVVISNVDFY